MSDERDFGELLDEEVGCLQSDVHRNIMIHLDWEVLQQYQTEFLLDDLGDVIQEMLFQETVNGQNH